jgi:hypothetical protein
MTFPRRLLLTTLLVSGMGAIAINPAYADSIKNAKIEGTAPTDYLLYDANATQTFLKPNASLETILSGDKNSPTGNVELAASSEKAGFNFSKVTTLKGDIGGRDISISSMTESDWNKSYGTSTFGQFWFNQAMTSNGFSTLVNTPASSLLFNMFKSNGGFQRFSDPNIAYVNQNDTGAISIGLAGHYNASPLFIKSIDQYLPTAPNSQKDLLLGLKFRLSNQLFQASEVFKYNYNGIESFGYSFQGTESGLIERGDQLSHSGNYEVTILGPSPRKQVPEPSVVMSFAGLTGFAAWKLGRSKRRSSKVG